MNTYTLALSDLEQARLEFPGTPDSQLVAELAQDLLQDLGLEPPIDHAIVASMRGVKTIKEAAIPWAGYLAPREDGLTITLRAGDSPGKKRFTAFHEVEHTFMPGFRTQPQYRCDPVTPVSAVPPRNASVEALCDVGAAELLFPRMWFAADLAGNKPTLGLVEQLAARYQASLEATARRLVTLHPTPALLIGLEPGCKPTQPHAEPVLRVQWVHANGSWPYVPRHKSAPESSVFTRALSGERIEELTTLKGLTSTDTPVHASSRLYRYTDDQGEPHMRVLALITPARSRRAGHAA